MINEIKKDAQERMQKSLDSLAHAFGQIRTGKAHPSILGSVMVPYYGADTSITQVANITVKTRAPCKSLPSSAICSRQSTRPFRALV